MQTVGGYAGNGAVNQCKDIQPETIDESEASRQRRISWTTQYTGDYVPAMVRCVRRRSFGSTNARRLVYDLFLPEWRTCVCSWSCGGRCLSACMPSPCPNDFILPTRPFNSSRISSRDDGHGEAVSFLVVRAVWQWSSSRGNIQSDAAWPRR